MDIRFWKEALLDLNTSLVVVATRLHEPSTKYGRAILLTGTPPNVPSSLQSDYCEQVWISHWLGLFFS